MVATLVLALAAVTAAVRPEIITPEPVTANAKLLAALQQAEDEFASVQRGLGLVGAAPLVGLGAEKAPVKPAARRQKVSASKTSSTKASVQKAALKTTP